MTQVRVLYQRTPMWRVGEDRPPCTRAELAARLDEFAALGDGERYPGDYSGRVISVVPADSAFTPADLADPRRGVALMDSDDVAALRSRRIKVVGKATADVTFPDRWGAVGERMRERCADPEAWERDEAEAVKAADASNEIALERYELEAAAHRIAREEYVREIMAFNLIEPYLGMGYLPPPVAPVPPAPPVFIEYDNAFEREAGSLARSLPPTVTHSGAGLYKVQAAGTMATPAHLWAMDAVDPPDDGSPGGNPGTGSNVTLVSGQIGSALEFNGTNSNVNVGDVAELNAVQKFTLALRMNQDVLNVSDTIFSKQVDGSHRVHLETSTTGGGRLRIFIANGDSDSLAWFFYSAKMSATVWYHLTVVFDGTQTGDANRLKVYLDGILLSVNFFHAIPAATADLSGINATIGAGVNAFDGKIDDVRIYADEAFTDAQVKDIAGRGITHWDTIVSAVKDNGTTTITLTTGTADDRTGEVFVSGGNSYAVSAKIDDTHITVIGDASGEAGACTVSPYSGFQSALDQLWADQGATEFTASQYVRVFAGTYDENVTPNAGLNPDEGAGFTLVIEGDPADVIANIILAPSAGVNAFYVNCDQAVIRHMTINGGSLSDHVIESGSGCIDMEVRGVTVTATPTSRGGIYGWFMVKVYDCSITTAAGYGVDCNTGSKAVVVRRTTIRRTGAQGGHAIICYRGALIVEACTISGFTQGIYSYYQNNESYTINCTIYDCARAFQGVVHGLQHATLIDCIVLDCDYVLYVSAWPDEASGTLAGPWVLRNNCYYGYTNFGYDGANAKTYAEFIAFDRVDASGDLDNTDPLMTDSVAGDFSLQTASPCRGTGHGSGVVAYVDGTAADPHHPNIGAEGIATDPPAPVWTAGLSGLAATDERVGDEIALAWGAASIGGSGLSVEYGVQRRIGAGAWTTVWIGSGTSMHVCECVTSQLYQFRVGARCADYEQDWVYPTDSATATATLPVPPTVADWTVSGTTVTVTLTGVAGRTYRVRLMDGAGGEDDEQGRTGSGDVALTAAGYGARYFAAWELIDGVQSEPTGVYAVTIDDPADAGIAYYRVRTVTGFPGAPHKVAMLERIERPIQP